MAKTILIIDDDPTLLKMVASFLGAYDYDVVTVEGGEEGLAYLKAHHVDLIVLDVHMPKMNGYTFVFEMKKIKDLKGVPIIVLTGKEGMAEIFKVQGVKEYLTKPFQSEVLLQAITKHI